MSSSSPASQLAVDLRPGRPPILVVDHPGDAPDWARRHREELRAAVARHGSIVVRGLGLADPAQVGAVFGQLGSWLMADRESFAARRRYAEGLYSSSKWPANQPMCMHHELSYAQEFPGMMLFACLRAADSGGATAVADASAVLAALPGELVDRFARQGWLLTRNYNDDMGASLADAFGTDDRAQVEAYCRANAIDVEWQPDGGLRTRQHRNAIIGHPETGAGCWFNQVAFLNEWTLDTEVREFLVDTFGPDGLPFTTHYGNGEPIGPDVVELINSVYDAHTVREPWQPGDLMLVDNIATAHSREAYRGEREVLVGMTDLLTMPPFAGAGS